MAVEVFKENITRKYRSTLFSKASLVCLIISVLEILVPLLATYRTGGFWFKTSTYQEQPYVRFKHEYIFLLETDQVLRSIVCGTGVGYDENRSHCLVKYVEEDFDHDGKPEVLNFNILVPMQAGGNVRSITAAFLMDLSLDDLYILRTDSLVTLYYSSSLPASKLEIVTDLRLHQAKPLTHYCINPMKRSLHLDGETEIQDILFSKSPCNVSLAVYNDRLIWTTGHVDNEFFTMKLKMYIPEASVLYKPGILQLLKWAWVQYLAVFFVFSQIFYLLKKFIYCNRLVWTHSYVRLESLRVST